MARYDLTEFEWKTIEPLLPNKPRGILPPGRRPSSAQWHLLGLAVRRAVGRSAGTLWPADHDLQSLQPLAEGWHLGPVDGRDHRRP